ncbi:uncharacterized protein HMPREF1541_03601 [Cyphellophora europaea CBS 101466]|uniref:C3H1-type domain-containing protein n=1 Tax=Cyphellophora europaea (strain CBS 101466) TaxID=1220924 RepID=W2RZA7_CYPE1|nr:uncharacterized protein HMPREF1541_03601 [Cyphellophora europaea CBS 101466]ETN41665.1 hypothetical protein HMPREF1541_03601 [Cyphellophora europaea CBS 101466]
MPPPSGDRAARSRSPGNLIDTPSAPNLVRTLTTAQQYLAKGIPELLDRLTKIEEENRSLHADLEDQSAGREQWMKRARKAEERQTAKPYLIAIIDGNGLCFRNRLLHAGNDGAVEAARSLAQDIRLHANLHHKNDLPRTIAVTVYVFLDIDKLALELIAADAIDEPDQLRMFLKCLSSQPLISVVDCNTQAVQSKVEQTYELHLENCHCQHAILALGPSSEYYSVLAEYADDEYTKLKTSLVKPGGGFPPEYLLPFYSAKLTSMHDVPLIPFAGDNTSELHPVQPLGHVVANVRDRPRPAMSDLVNIAESEPISAEAHGVSIQQKSLPSSSLTSFPSAYPSNAEQVRPPIKASSDPASSRSSALSHERSTDSPSRQQDWEVENHLSKLPDRLPTNRPCTEPFENFVSSPTLTSGPFSGGHGRQQSNSSSRTSPGKLTTKRTRRRVAASPPRQSSPPQIALPPAPSVPWNPMVPLRNDILRNRHEQRIDPPLPEISAADHKVFHARIKRQPLCNNHQLRGECPANGCNFDHSPITPQELLVLMHKARDSPCRLGNDCVDFGCPHGHHCRSRVLGPTHHIEHGRCRFRNQHLDVTSLEVDESKIIYCQEADANTKKAAAARMARQSPPTFPSDSDVWA